MRKMNNMETHKKGIELGRLYWESKECKVLPIEGGNADFVVTKDGESKTFKVVGQAVESSTIPLSGNEMDECGMDSLMIILKLDKTVKSCYIVPIEIVRERLIRENWTLRIKDVEEYMRKEIGDDLYYLEDPTRV